MKKAQGDLPSALEAFERSLAIIDRLAKSRPSNAQWQCDLAASYSGLGSVYVAQKHDSEARKALQTGRAIIDRLVALSPDNAGWKNDLAGFDELLAALKPANSWLGVGS